MRAMNELSEREAMVLYNTLARAKVRLMDQAIGLADHGRLYDIAEQIRILDKVIAMVPGVRLPSREAGAPEAA